VSGFINYFYAGIIKLNNFTSILHVALYAYTMKHWPNALFIPNASSDLRNLIQLGKVWSVAILVCMIGRGKTNFITLMIVH